MIFFQLIAGFRYNTIEKVIALFCSKNFYCKPQNCVTKFPSSKKKIMIDLHYAQQLVLAEVDRLGGEDVALADGLVRVAAVDIKAGMARPSFDESTRDGYCLPPLTDNYGEDRHNKQRYKIAGEIPAGRASEQAVRPGYAHRIMTGGCVPAGCVRVVPFEQCSEDGQWLSVRREALFLPKTFIRRKGCEIAEGDRLVAAGQRLLPQHLALLAGCGVDSVTVVKKPVVGYICSGSELKISGRDLRKGEKISSNSYLLQGLLRINGSIGEGLGLIRDDIQSLQDCMIEGKQGKLDMIISTGGLGPGKYDLVRAAFGAVGGRIIFTSLAMRPGKSVLFGVLGKTLFFGLPGPPYAVKTLFDVLVVPALVVMQGREGMWPKKMRASLRHGLEVGGAVLRLKDAIMEYTSGQCTVRVAERFEMANCYLILEAGQNHYPAGAPVDILVLERRW